MASVDVPYETQKSGLVEVKKAGIVYKRQNTGPTVKNRGGNLMFCGFVCFEVIMVT